MRPFLKPTLSLSEAIKRNRKNFRKAVNSPGPILRKFYKDRGLIK